MRYLLFLLSLITFSSCHFYHSEVPISAPEKSSVDPHLVGKWFLTETDKSGLITKSNEYLDVIDFNGKEYAVIAQSEEGRTLFRVHSSVIQGKTYLNILQRDNFDGETPKYFFFSLDSIDDEYASLRYLTDSIKTQFNSSKALSKYLTKNFNKIDKEWMSEPFRYHRESYFLWDRINEDKSGDIENMWSVEGSFTELRDKTAAQLSIMEKNELDRKMALDMISKAYLSHSEPETYSYASSYLLRFKNGKMLHLQVSSDAKSFYIVSERQFYKIKEN